MLRAAAAVLCLLLASAAAAAPGASYRTMSIVRVMVDCQVLPDRRVEDCRVVRETPQGRGWGAHVLSLFARPDYRVREDQLSRVVEGRITFDVPLTAISAPGASAD